MTAVPLLRRVCRCGIVPLLATTLVAATAAAQPLFDDFEDGTNLGWDEETTNIPDGGPDGVGDNYLQVVSDSDLFGPGSRMVARNKSQWTGDLLAAGVQRIEAQMRCFVGCPRTMRIAVEGGGAECGFNCGVGQSSRYVTSSGVVVDDSGWRLVSLDLRDSILLEGSHSLDEVLASVTQLRILSSDSPTWRGDLVTARMGIDDIRVVAPVSGSPTAVPALRPLQALLLAFLLAALALARLRAG